LVNRTRQAASGTRRFCQIGIGESEEGDSKQLRQTLAIVTTNSMRGLVMAHAQAAGTD